MRDTFLAHDTAGHSELLCWVILVKFLRRAARSGLCESVTTAEELVDDADERLFSKVRQRAHHVLEDLLPPKPDPQHNLRKQRHNITLPEKKGHLAAKNYIIRLLFCTKTPTDFNTSFLIT